MTANDQSVFSSPGFNKRMTISVLGICIALFVYGIVELSAPNLIRSTNSLVDFEVFYLVGDMIWRGDLELAYYFKSFSEEQSAFYDTNSFMPWTYPPHFDLLVAPLALMPIGLAYALFIGLSLVAYVAILHLFSGKHLGVTLLIIFPVFVLNIRIGQNGFLTAALVGCFLLAFLKKSKIAGIPLGLMIIKPHLAAAIGLLTLLSRRVSVVLIALAIIIVSTIFVTLFFGPEIWEHFLNGVREASIFLKHGLYPLFRMTSLYAAFHQLDVAPYLALAFQIGTALIVCTAIVFCFFKISNQRYLLAFIAMVSVWVSPYNYDYDLAIWGLAIAILIPDLVQKASQNELLILLLLCWVASGSGILQSYLEPATSLSNNNQTNNLGYPIAAFALIAAQSFIFFILNKRQPADLTAS